MTRLTETQNDTSTEDSARMIPLAHLAWDVTAQDSAVWAGWILRFLLSFDTCRIDKPVTS